MDLHVFPILIPPPTSLSTQSLWVFSVHQARAPVSCIQPGLMICFIYSCWTGTACSSFLIWAETKWVRQLIMYGTIISSINMGLTNQQGLVGAFSSVTESCLTVCDPMSRSTPGLPVHHQLLELTQTYAHRVSDAIQASHPLSSTSAPAPHPSQHQGLFQWVNSSHKVAKVLEFQLQHQSFQWTPKTYLLQVGLVGSPCSPRDSQESSPTPQFKSINSSLLSFLHSPTLTSIHDHWKNHGLDKTDLCWQSNVSAFYYAI